MKVRPHLPKARRLLWNPSADDLQELTGRMPNARRSEFTNRYVQTVVDSRSAGCTYIVTDDPASTWGQTISVEEGVRLGRLQDDHIAVREMLVIDGYIGNDPEFRTATRLMIEKENANIAGMRKILYYEADKAGEDFEPELTVIYTPNLAVAGYPSLPLA